MVPWVITGICISALRKSTSLCFCTWSICFSFRETFLYLFFRCYVVRIILFKCKCGEKGYFLHMSEEKGNAKRFVCHIATLYISLVFSMRGTLYLHSYQLSVLTLSFNPTILIEIATVELDSIKCSKSKENNFLFELSSSWRYQEIMIPLYSVVVLK